MKFILASLVSLLLFPTLNLLAQSKHKSNSAILQGHVLTADGAPATYITLKLLSADRGCSTDSSGAYRLEKINPGDRTLEISAVGSVTKVISVHLEPDQVLTRDFRLKETARQLEEIIVNAYPNKYAYNEATDGVAKLPLKNLDNPQVYNVVSTALMAEQISVSYQSALQNISGATSTTVKGGNGGSYVMMRGFYSTAIFRDGLPVNTYAGIDPVNIESIQAIKGPSSALFGSTVSYGGLINRITKQPYDSVGGTVGYSIGNFGLNRATADVNVPLNSSGSALMRLNAALHREGSFQDYGFQHNYTIAPSFLFRLNQKASLSVDMEFYHSDWISGYYFYMPSGLWDDIRQIPIGYRQSLAGNDLVNHISTYNLYTKLDYQLSKSWKSQSAFTLMNNQWHDLNSFSLYYLKDSLFSRGVNQGGNTRFNSYDFEQNFIGRSGFGGMQHQLLLGLSYYRFEQNIAGSGMVYYDTLQLPAAGVPPFSSKRVTAMSALNPYTVSGLDNYTLAAYGQDVIHFSPNFITMLSLRADRFHADPSTSNGKQTANTSYTQTALSPKIGIVYQPIVDQLSFFGSFMDGFVNHGPVSQPDGSVDIFRPEHGQQWETGVKLDVWHHKLSGTLSYYHIKVKDKIRADATNGFSIQDGTQRNRGLELTLITAPLKGWNILAGYGYLDTRMIRAGQGVTGKEATISPHNISNLWMSYQLPCGLGAGLGGNYAGRSFGDALNTYIIPEYTVANATLFYQGKLYRIGLKANNLTNTHYWDANRYPQPLRQFIANFSYRF